ncbi:hypothetical protein Pcinc_016959 [Petrolisthes cinctipes]|uniref:Uncharacterized protein n=1 Tax=Petrolisthes cinctipes TaxID=88211 RepID=A0AAE1FRN4_PETCI|nr:hypothetical protein Pcinc_016959 [Petrolisthes cinctipes]
MSITSIKYVISYLAKGPDMAIISIQEVDKNDEIECYLVGRYVGPVEAATRIFGFKIHLQHPRVQQLEIHLENEQIITFNPENCRPKISNPRQTTLTAVMELKKNYSFS